MPGGAVNRGEDVVQAFAREASAEFGLAVDMEHAVLIGGYQRNRARDGCISDNFTVLALTATTKEIRMDEQEIHEAAWLPCGFGGKPGLLKAWRDEEQRNKNGLDPETGHCLKGSKVTLDWGSFGCEDALDSNGRPRLLRSQRARQRPAARPSMRPEAHGQGSWRGVP